jgi:hypothetical protein
VNGRLWQRLLGLERRQATAAPSGGPRINFDALADGSAAGDPAWAWLYERGRVEDPAEGRVNGDDHRPVD